MKIMVMQGKHLREICRLSHSLSYFPYFDLIKFLSIVYYTIKFGSKPLLFGILFMFLC